MNSNNKQFKIVGNGLFQCEDCLAFTGNPEKHKCDPLMKKIFNFKKGKNDKASKRTVRNSKR